MYFSDEVNLNNKVEVEEITAFLNRFEIEYELPDKTYVIREEGEIIATGSASGNILKYFFVKCTHSGQGAVAIIFNSLLDHLLENGHSSYFVFTTPANINIFESLGLKLVQATDRVALLEGGFYNYDKWVDIIKSKAGIKRGKRGAIIVNTNPMTLGHKYLMEKALEDVDELLIFVVEEDLSLFPFEARYNIVRNEFVDNQKITVLKGGPYIISRGTFPTYFIKQKDQMLEIYTELDAKIFAEKIAKDLEIDMRFLGSEPKDLVTLQYNTSLADILEKSNIYVKIIERIESEGQPISASRVRQLLKEDKYEEAYEILPNSTIEYLKSPQGKQIIEKIKSHR